MAYDLLIKNGRIVDGSGMPAFRGDVGVKDGKIAEIGKLSGPATRTIDAAGRVVAPGFIDNHCHYDAQVTWDPLCSFSCDHGATTVIFGNCSLSLAPVRKGKQDRLAEFLSYVEAIPMEVLRTLEFGWETVPAISRPARPSSRRQCRQSDRPHRGALLRDGRRLPEAHRDRRRDQGDAGSRARRHEGRCAGRVGVAQPGPFRPAGGAHPGVVGRREGNLRARRRVARTRHRHHPIGRRQRRRNEERADEPAVRGDRPPARLQQSEPVDAAARRVEASRWRRSTRRPRRASAPTRCARRTASSTISRCATPRPSAVCRSGTRSACPRPRRC